MMKRAILTLLRVAAVHNGNHRYLSDHCLHGDHTHCHIVCALCGAMCLCECHEVKIV